MNLEKRKGKNEEAPVPGWLYFFISPLQMDVIIPHPLETCAELLRRKHNTRFWASRITNVELTMIDDDTYTFNVNREANRDAVEAEGYLNRWQENTTRIIAEINVPLRVYKNFLLIIIFATLFTIFTALKLHPGVIIFFAVMMLLMWYSIRHSRYELRHWLVDVLQPEIQRKKKR